MDKNQSNIDEMRILKKKSAQSDAKTSISLELRVTLLRQATITAKKAGVSRQKLINLILEQALNDPHFTLKID